MMRTAADIVIPCHNGGRFLRESVASCLNQTLPPARLWIIDDASSDDSAQILESFAASNPTITIIKNRENIGKPNSLNAVFDRVESPYLAILDQDDLCEPNRLERQVAFMESDGRLGCSSSFVRYINASGRLIGKGVLDNVNEGTLRGYLDSDEPFGLFCPASILRKEVFQNRQLRFRAHFWPAEDIDLWNRIAEAGWKVLAQPEYLVRYRIHGSSMVASQFRKTRTMFDFVRACLRARRAGQEEPTREQFLQKLRELPWPTRMNRSRKIEGKARYRQAGLQIGEGRYLAACYNLFLAVLLQPAYTVPRCIQQGMKR